MLVVLCIAFDILFGESKDAAALLFIHLSLSLSLPRLNIVYYLFLSSYILYGYLNCISTLNFQGNDPAQALHAESRCL